MIKTLLLLTIINAAACFPVHAQGADPTRDAITDTLLGNFIKSGTGQYIEVGAAIAEEVIATAKSFLGTPHCMGGRSVVCFDCSGFLVYTFNHHDIRLRGSSMDIARNGKAILDRRNLSRGDLVFFTNTFNSPNLITHSGIYLGDGYFIHASSRSGVTITRLSHPYWKKRYLFGTRIFNPGSDTTSNP